MPVPANTRPPDMSALAHRPGPDSMYSKLAARAKELDLGALRLDEGETFQNRFLLVWHNQAARFNPSQGQPDEYQTFWQDFARTVCAAGPRAAGSWVDDTLHVFPRESSGEGTFWVV